MRKFIIPKIMISLVLLLTFLAACSSHTSKVDVSPTARSETTNILPGTLSAAPTVQVPQFSVSPTITKEPTEMPTLTASLVPSRTPTTASTHTPTETPLPSITPTYAILRGTVLEQANCRYGPGAAYLYKYGVYAGYYMDIIGRNETGTWVMVQAIGGDNPCWVKASLIDIKGGVMSLAPTSLPLPESPYYGPLTGVSAIRKSDSIIISWDPLILRAGDDSLQYPYLVEAWLCTDKQIVFRPIGSWETILTVRDESGCSEASHARVYGVEKHGYTAWVNIPWPQP